MAGIDFAAWRNEIRALASIEALDETAADPRSALVALMSEDVERAPGEIGEGADLTALLPASPRALAFAPAAGLLLALFLAGCSTPGTTPDISSGAGLPKLSDDWPLHF